MNNNAHTSLEIPILRGVDPEAARSINERLRTIAAALDSLSSGSAKAIAGDASGRALILSVPGTLGVRTDAAPRVSLAFAATPTGLWAALKQPPQGASVKVKLQVAGVDYTAVEIAGGTSVPVLIAGALGGSIAANGLVTLNVVQV